MPYTHDGSPYASGPHGETSHAAAQHADRSREHKGRLYLKLLYSRGPLTDHEAAAVLGLPLSSINSTRNAVMVYELVERTTTQRKTPYNQFAWVWEITPAGKAAVVRMLPKYRIDPPAEHEAPKTSATVQGHDINEWGLR